MTPLDEQTFRELCLLHALGTLGPKEEAILIRSLEHADEERLAFFAEMSEHQVMPDPGRDPLSLHAEMKRKLAARIGPASPRPARPGADSRRGWARFPRARVLAFASLILAAGLITFSAWQWRRAEKSLADARLYQGRLEALQDSLGAREALLGVLSSPQVRLASLKRASLKSGADASASGRVFWDATARQGVLHVSALPPAPSGQAYYLWILVDDKTDPCVNAGSFAVRRLRSEGDFYRFQGDEDLSHMKILGFEITAESMAGREHREGHSHEHLHPTGRTLLKTETFL